MSQSKLAALERLPKKPDDPDNFPPGTLLDGGRFEVEARIGRGGVAAVYRATDSTRGMKVALKVLHASRAREQRELHRFRNEAAITEHVGPHPHLIQPFEAGTLADLGRPYLLSELGGGPTLRNVLLSEPLAESRALALFEQIGSGLAHLHDAGILHRDIKPANVIVAKGREGSCARLFDFGYAIRERDLTDIPADARLTAVGELPGTKHYMAPEQVLGQPASKASDVYALGATLYEALCGAPLYADLSPADAAIRKATKDTEAPDISTRTNVSHAMARLVADAMAPDPARRIRDAHGFVERVRAIRDGTEGTVARAPVPNVEPPAVQSSDEVRPSRGRLVAFLAVAASVLGLGVGWALFAGPNSVEEQVRGAATLPSETPRSLLGAPKGAMGEAEPQGPTALTRDVGGEVEAKAPVPEPAPAVAPVSVETPPKPRAAKPKAPKPEVPEPKLAVDCEAERAAANQATEWRDWGKLARHTKHAKCWDSRRTWERLRVKALQKSGAFAACRKLAQASRNPEIKHYEKLCASTPTDTPR